MFHADDVFSAALLKILNPKIKIERVLFVPDNFRGIAFDIGDGKYDHHQKENEVRPDGVPYASFGKLWRDFAPALMGDEYAQIVDTEIVKPIDWSDNGGPSNPLSMAIASFNPAFDSGEDYDVMFKKAVKFAFEILKREIAQAIGQEKANKCIDRDIEHSSGDIVVLSNFCSWYPKLIETDAKFVIFPSPRGGYNVQGIPRPGVEHFPIRVPFPSRWLGAGRDRLKKEVPGFVFCHKDNFLAAAKNLDAAKKIAEIAITEYRKKEGKC